MVGRITSAIVSPEGNPDVEGKILPFLGGTGLMAVSVQVPIVPFKVEDDWQLFPDSRTIGFPNFPDKRGTFRLAIGEPVTFPKNMAYQEATERARLRFSRHTNRVVARLGPSWLSGEFRKCRALSAMVKWPAQRHGNRAWNKRNPVLSAQAFCRRTHRPPGEWCC
jgi:hypothetical protein